VSVYCNTINFILIIFGYILICIVYEAILPFGQMMYILIMGITDMILEKTILHLGGRLEIYYVFLFGSTIFLLTNLMGLLPFTTSFTAHFIFAFFFSLVYFIVNLISAILFHKSKIFNLFLPNNVPIVITPGLIIIESISFFSRALSLAIRLFANIVAGHILLKILASFLYIILYIHMSFCVSSFILWAGIIIIISLEVFISILQVYIFNLLVIIYINNVLNLH